MELNENERIDDLEFKELKIIQNKKWFCYGTDSVLLSDFAKNIKNNSTVIDLGTGTGIISLLLCKKTNLKKIYGIEVQKEVAEMAKRSCKLNNLEEKFEIINKNLKDLLEDFEIHSIDVIVTNPPYMRENSGLKNDEGVKTISRHEVECNLEDIINISSKLLISKGEFYMVYRSNRLVDAIYLLRKYKIEPKTIRFIFSNKNSAPELFLIKAVKDAGSELKVEKPLYVYDEKGNYTNEILEIYNKK